LSLRRADPNVCKKVFDGLCWLGFKSSEARRALDACKRDGDLSLDAEQLLKKALQHLG
jgi:Holliday junction resolvasome RuvABC DNA-binding subunit